MFLTAQPQLTLSAAGSVGVMGPIACKNNPIVRAEHTPLIPPKSSYSFGRNIRMQTPLFNKTVSDCPQLFRGPCRAEKQLHAPPPLRTGHFKKAQLAAVGATVLIQLLHKPFLRHRHPASVRWVWRGHRDPIHVRNVMGVWLRGSPLVLRTDL